MSAAPFSDLNLLAKHLREELENKKFILLYAYNGTGKTRLSMAFKDTGKNGNERDTLYFNAFTEDLFSWDNDLGGDSERILKINSDSSFFAGLRVLDMNSKIRPLLERYADFYFTIYPEDWKISFSRDVTTGTGDRAKSVRVEDIKISRSEENLFIWCFFLAILQLVVDGDEAYDWVKYIYIDDPISSLDENNAIAVATHLAQMLTKLDKVSGTVISTHHVLFFNVLCNELKQARKHLLTNDGNSQAYLLSDTTSKPFLHHLANLVDLNDAQNSGDIKRHHFNMMRCIMEQTAIFCGMDDWKQCLKVAGEDPDKALHERMINVMSHADYLINEPNDLMEEYKDDFRKIFQKFIAYYPFNQALFPSAPTPEEAPTS